MNQKTKEKIGFFEKWNIYQKERFPVMVYGLYIFCIVFAIFCYANTVFNNMNSINYFFIIPMYIFAFLQFLMVRIVDEFKDYDEDSKYRPYRPVPRGLITLKELKILFLICVFIQIVIVLLFNKQNMLLLFGFWGFFGLFCKDFFIKKFLDKHIVLTVAIDELLVVFLGLYLYSFIGKINSQVILILLMLYFVSWIVEIARKVRCKEDEEKGVKTYTAVIGIGKTILILFILETILMLLQIKNLGINYLIWIIPVYVVTNIINVLFVKYKNKKYAKLVELFANIYIVIIYLSMGLLLI
ncbi:MAG: UbiA family prenyltransferase [Clostridia bacterium]|nr:UbiA family prenyltransferase [Clostridia bacterium]